MADHRITDFVDPSALEGLRKLKEEMVSVKDTYLQVAQDLLKGLKVPVEGMEGLESMMKRTAELQKQAAEAVRKHSAALDEENRIAANTTNTISRQLMEQEKLNAKTRESYQRQKDVKDALEKAVTSYSDMTKRLAEISVEQDRLNKLKKDEKKAYEEEKITYEQYTASLQEIIRQQQALSAEKAQLESYTKSEVRENANASSSYNAMSQELSRLKKAYRELAEEERNSEFGQNMLNEIQQLGAHLKDMDATMGDFQRNVGDYAIAGGSVKKELKELVMEIANLTVAYRSMSDEEKASAEGQELSAKIQGLTEQAGVLKDAVADTQAAVKNAASDTRAFDQISAGIKLLIDGFGLATGAAEMLGLSEQDLMEIQAKLQAAIVASNAVTSIQNALQKQSALMQGITTLQTKAAAAAISLKTAAEGKGIIATKAATVAQAALNAVAKANPYVLLATVIALVVAGIIALVSANKKAKKADEEAAKAAEERTKALQKQREAAQKLRDSIADSAASQIGALSKLRYEWGKLSTDMEKIEFIKRNKTAFQELGYSVNSVTEAEKILKKNTNTVIQIMILRARAAAYAQMVTEAWAEALRNIDGANHFKYRKYNSGQSMKDIGILDDNLKDATMDKNERGVRYNGAKTKKYWNYQGGEWTLTDEGAKFFTQKSMEKEQAKAKNTMSEEWKKAEDMEKKVTGLLTATEKQIGQLVSSLGVAEYKGNAGGSSGGSASRSGGSSSSSSSSSSSDADKAKSQEELENEIIKLRKESIEAQLEMEEEGSDKWLELKKQSIEVESTLSLKAVLDNQKTQLEELQKSYEAKKMTLEEYEAKAAEIEELSAQRNGEIVAKREADMEDALEKASQYKKNAILEEYATQQVIDENEHARRLTDLKEAYAKELELHKGSASEVAEIRKKYEDDVAAANEDFAEETAKKQLWMYMEIANISELSAEEREQMDIELGKAAEHLRDVRIDAAVSAADKEIELQKKITDETKEENEKRKESIQSTLQYISQSIGAITDLANTFSDIKIEKIEEDEEAQEEAAQAEIDRIQDLVDKKVITEEEGEARKRAAETVSEQKAEELAAKKQKVQQRQAIWDKANNLAQTGINTATSIMTTAARLGFPAAIPFIAMASAMGALQMANIIATPIPKYAKGTGGHPGGLAIVGDGGKREIVSFGGGMYLTPDTPTLVDMPKGAEVYPDADKIMLSMDSMRLPGIKDASPRVVVNSDFRPLERKIDEFALQVRKQSRQRHRDAVALRRLRWKESHKYAHRP